MVTPLAVGVKPTWQRLLKSESGAGPITKFDASDLSVRYGCEVKSKEQQPEDGFDPDDWMDHRDQRRVDPFIMYGMAAAKEAIADSGWTPETDEDRWRTGVIIGSGIGGLPGISDASLLLAEKGPRR
ncbi:MAG: beta-ketoacyl-ACP synthase II, partial [Minwuiales bacterium]|nr:beta-ketoacyl-ACP synthase II [Minwuiales bacterium]